MATALPAAPATRTCALKIDVERLAPRVPAHGDSVASVLSSLLAQRRRSPSSERNVRVWRPSRYP